MRRALSIAVVAFWLLMMGLLVRRVWQPVVAAPAPNQYALSAGEEEWMGVYHEGRKIGYTHHRLAPEGDGYVFAEESLLRLTLMEVPQTVRTRMQGHCGKDYALRDAEFAVSSGQGNLQATAVVADGTLRLTLHTGHESSEDVRPLQEPVYLPSTLRAAIRAEPIRAGREVGAAVFDLTTMQTEHIRVVIQDQEPVPQASPSVQGWRVHEELHGLKTTAWIDATGAVLREEGPMGLVLVRQTAAQVMAQDWSTSAALDVMASAAIPVAQPIADARQRMTLQVRLSGIAVDRVPSDDEQVRHEAVLSIRRPALGSLASYPLPYDGRDHADDLAATGYLQIQHPRVQAAAHEALGGARDARAAATRLNDWVYAHLRKEPTVSIPNALQVLEMGAGDCNEHAVLFAALGRAVGLPTRLIAGAVYLDGAFFYHAWCEVWLGRWVSIDPTFHQFPADATHIKLVVGGPEEQLGMMDMIGRLGIEVLDSPTAAR
jgi:transglutaminase superfamily protein